MNANSLKWNLNSVKFVLPKTGDADNHCNLSFGLQSCFSQEKREGSIESKAISSQTSKAMKSDPISNVDDATIWHAIALALGSKLKGFWTDRGAKLLRQDSEGVWILAY